MLDHRITPHLHERRAIVGMVWVDDSDIESPPNVCLFAALRE